MNKRKNLKIIGIIFLIIALPLALILVKHSQDNRSHAAAADKLEAEGGVLGGNAKPQNDSYASGGQYVAFINSGQTPTPTPSNITYAATYTSTSSTDQTSALTSFIQSHAHQRIAVSGIIPVRRVDIVIPAGAVTTIDFLPGSRIQEIQTGTPALLLYESWDIVLNNPNISGTGYTWITTTPEVEDPNQVEHAISIDSGGRITINNPYLRDTRGDGIYSGFDNGDNQPPVAIVVNNPDIERSSRNGISPVAGEITIKGGHIDRSGLANIDFEPNNPVGASSIKGTISDIRLTHHCDLPSPCGFGDYAIAAGGTRTGVKNNINIQRVTGDRLITAFWDTSTVIFQNNTSDVSTTATFTNISSVTFSGNTNITRR